MLDQEARGISTGGHAEAFARCIGMGFDSAFTDIEQARHFLSLQMFRNQAEDFLLALRQGSDLDPNILHCPAPVSHKSGQHADPWEASRSSLITRRVRKSVFRPVKQVERHRVCHDLGAGVIGMQVVGECEIRLHVIGCLRRHHSGIKIYHTVNEF